jgi:hypothetical protein
VWDFIGGEPFLEIDLIDSICDYIKMEMFRRNHHWFNSYRLNFTTNGINYHEKKIQDFIKKNRDHVDQLTLSEYMRQSDHEPIETTVSKSNGNDMPHGSVPLGKDGEFVGQTTLFDKDKLEKKRLRRYENDTELAELARSVDDTFTARQMRLIAEVVRSKGIPKEKTFEVLRSHYLMLQVADEQGDGIKNKFKYYLQMLKTYKLLKEEECAENESSFNIDEWYKSAESYDPESIGFKEDDT